jgi:hypothetical protein
MMNPQRARHLSPPPAPAVSQPDGFGGADDKGDGSAQSGYARPEFGPFECENCQHFQAPNQCNHPEVESDPEVNGQVDPEGCCNLFQSAHNETEEEEHSEGLAENEPEEK